MHKILAAFLEKIKKNYEDAYPSSSMAPKGKQAGNTCNQSTINLKTTEVIRIAEIEG